MNVPLHGKNQVVTALQLKTKEKKDESPGALRGAIDSPEINTYHTRALTYFKSDLSGVGEVCASNRFLNPASSVPIQTSQKVKYRP